MFATEIAFHRKIFIDHIANANDLVFCQLIDPTCRIDADFGANVARIGRSDSENIAKSNHNPLICR